MTKYMSITYLFGLILFGIGLISFIWKLVVIINEFSDYENTLLIIKELAPGFLMALIGMILLVLVQTRKAKQNTKDQIRKVIESEKAKK